MLLVPDYRPTNKRPGKILKNPFINQFDRPAAGEEKSTLIKLGINQLDDMSLLQARKKSAETVWEYFSFNLKAFCPSGKSLLFPSLNIIET